MIPVLTSQGFQRFVTLRQGPAEIAGKVLAPFYGLWRKAERRLDPKIGDYWFAFYVKPTEIEVTEWANHRPDREMVGKVAH